MSEKQVFRQTVTILALSLAMFSCTDDGNPMNSPPSAWNGDFVFGPYAIGFKSQSIERPGPEGPREFTYSMWYPAEANNRNLPVMQVADYFQITLEEEQLLETVGLAEERAFAAAMTGDSTALSFASARSGLDAPVAAHTGALPASGPFPIVLWSTRHATVLAQAPLAEVLASHGFVVATTWSSAPPLAFIWEDRSAAEKLATIEVQTDDLSRTLEELRNDAFVDGEKVVVLAWSYGGQSAARLQERDPSVRGIVSLDANVLPSRPEESFEPVHPLVNLVGRDTSGRGYEHLRALSTPWISFRFPELEHGNFNALEGYLPGSLGANSVYSWSRGGPIARAGYRSIVRIATSAAQALSEEGITKNWIAGHRREADEETVIEVVTPDLDED